MDAPLLQTFREEADSLRAFRRFNLNLLIGISLDASKPLVRGAAPLSKTKASMTNTSLSGFCFSSLSEFPEDTVILIELEMGRQTHRVPAIVRRCAPGKKMGRIFYECGAQYLKSDATLRFLPCMAKFLLTLGAETNTAKEPAFAAEPHVR